MVAKKIDAGVYKRGDKYVAKNKALGHHGTFTDEQDAKDAMKAARIEKDAMKAKANTARDKATKAKKDASGETLHDSREAWLNRRW